MNPTSIRRKVPWILGLLFAFFMVDQHSARANTSKKDVEIDPVVFTLASNHSSVTVGEEFEITIECRALSNWDERLLSTVLDREFRLKLVFPEGFLQTGGNYADFIGDRLSAGRAHVIYKVRGRFERVPDSGTFLLLRGTKHSVELGRFLARGQIDISVKEAVPNAVLGKNARALAFSQCLEAESMNSATGPVTSDPNASNGQTRGAENQYNHYVDYVLSDVPASGIYQLVLRYYSSASPVITLIVNSGAGQVINLANSNSWNISYTETTLNVNLSIGNNTIRIAGTGGGSCRQDRICVTGFAAPCSAPPAPSISKTAGSTVCSANNQTVTLTAGGALGTITWFRDGTQVGTGNSITKSDAGSYIATCSKDGCTSLASPAIIISQTANCGGNFSQCLEAESMNGANGAISSDPNASNGQTRGAENQVNHYVDYLLTSVPASGSYKVKLQYYSSAAPVVHLIVNGGAPQTFTLPNSASWNISHTEHIFTVNLNAGNNTVRIAGSGGGSCRQDRICVVSNTGCIKPSAPTISKTAGTTACAAANQTITLTATAYTGTVTWFKDGVETGSGLSITKSEAGAYTATCSKDGCTSDPSASIVINATANCGVGFSQCVEAELMNNANGPISSDPNASGGKTRGAENQYNHYVDYVLSGVPSAGSYLIKLRYYSSTAPTVSLAVNGGGSQTSILANSGTWNIGYSDHTFTANLAIGNNTIRIAGIGGGSCRQDRICVTGGGGSPCPAAPMISKTAGTSVCAATNQTVTLTATGYTGTVVWYKDGAQIAAGISYTTPAAGSYSATCTADGCVSAASNPVSVIQTAGCSGGNPLTPKISSTGFPEVLTLSIVADPGLSDSWLISDLGTVSLPAGYEWSYFIGNKWVKRQTNLVNEPWQSNSPGRIVKMATKIGLDTLNRWPCPNEGCGYYYQADAVAQLVPGARGGLTTFIFN
jgi:hypothetical protein